MRALIRTSSTKSLRLDPNHPKPIPSSSSSSKYIIQTKATALTRGELAWPEPLSQNIPIPGYDLAGVVVSGPKDTDTRSSAGSAFKPGDEIYALTAFNHQGNAREYTEAQKNEMALKPKHLTWEDAAAVPLSALSAWQALFVHGKLATEFGTTNSNEGKRVLITAASGGVGIWGVQLAHAAGAEVIGTCGSSNVEFVEGLRANTVIDYTKMSLLDWVGGDRDARGFDVVLDCIGGQTLVEAWQCARKGGKVISVAEPPDPKRPVDGVAEAVEGVWFIVVPDGKQLAEISDLIEQGKCKPAVDGAYDLEDYERAFERLEGGHARGKVVLKVY